MKNVRLARELSLGCAGLLGVSALAMCFLWSRNARTCWDVLAAELILIGRSRSLCYFTGDLYDLAFQFDLSLGILAAVAGLSMLLRTDELMGLYPFLTGAMALTDCGFKLQAAMDACRFGIRGWRLLTAGAVLGIGGGIYLMTCARQGAGAAPVCGAVLVVDSLLSMLTDLLMVKIPSERSQER